MALAAGALRAQNGSGSLSNLSLEDLMNIEVVSVSRRAQSVSKSASAVFVITREDLRRSGATNIPEALRMAPGVHVARLDNNKWSISIRGFNNRFTDKLLVMVDGRSVYTPLFSGVYWEALEMPLEDIERIEVIRGPGGTMWGSNAVNGVINIITMSAERTQGVLASAGGGTRDRAYATARFGGAMDNGVFYRFSSRGARRATQFRGDGGEAGDDWDSLQGGFRADWQASDSTSLMLSGGVYRGDAAGRLSLPSRRAPYQAAMMDDIRMSTSNVLGRWTKAFKGGSLATFQFYHDRFDRRETLIGYRTDSLDFDFQHDFDFTGNQRILWGVGYRSNSDSIESTTPWASFTPDHLHTSLVNLFVQDDIGLIGEKLVLTVGTKFERNSYTGWETQPSASLIWNRSPSEALWGSVARAVRIPSRYSRDVTAEIFGMQGPFGIPGVVRLVGAPAPGAESLVAYQAGYRTSLFRGVTLDLTAFLSDYDNVFGTIVGQPFLERTDAGRLLVAPLQFANGLEGSTRGAEAQVNYRVLDRWNLSGAYSWLNTDLRSKPDSPVQGAGTLNAATPKNLFSGRSRVDLPGHVEFDLALYYAGASGEEDPFQSSFVAPYHRLDARLGWRPNSRVGLSFSVENILDDRHLEVTPSALDLSSEIGRNAHVRLTFSF